jgi:hypothetical protein
VGQAKLLTGTLVVEKDGIGAVTDPIYVWNNTGTGTSGPRYVGLNQYGPDECGNGQLIENYLKKNRDYFVDVTMPQWTPFAYPHPLRSHALGPNWSPSFTAPCGER